MSEQDLIQLKEMVLNAVINQETLPGSDQPVMFPDLPLLLDQSAFYLLDKHIKNPGFVKRLNKPVLLTSNDFLAQEATKKGKLLYLQVQEKEPGNNTVVLTVESRVMSSDKQSYTLSSMQFRLQKIKNEWRVVEHPTSMSA